jgi:hypothetical protein
MNLRNLKNIGILAVMMGLTGCGKSSTVSGGQQEVIDLNLGGAPFNGTFTNLEATDQGSISFSITQLGDQTLTGLITVGGSVCLESGSLQGQLTGSNANLVVQQSSGTLVFAVQATTNTLSGSYTVEFTGDSKCSSESRTGNFEATR